MKLIYPYLCFMMLSITSAYGQSQIPQVINVSGGSSKTQGYTLQWSIGELSLVNELDAPDSSYIITNGFIQPTEGLVQPPVPPPVVSFNGIDLTAANIRVFPNPTQDILEIDFFQKFYTGKISIQLYDELGNAVYTKQLSTYGSHLIQKIYMNKLTKGLYILYIKRLNPISGQYDLDAGSFKIIKL